MIHISDLSIRFQDGSSISYDDMTLDSGTTYALLGASGCGKTTLLNLLSGIQSPTTGRVEIDGCVISQMTQRQRDNYRIRHIGNIFQDFKLLEDMTVADNINVLRLEHVDTAHMDALLDHLGILSLRNRRVRRLSGGERQRVAIARALIKEPHMILADEPTGSLNFETGERVVQQLIENAGSGTLIVVTHDDRLTPQFDRVIDMNAVAHFTSAEEVSGHV